MHRRKMIQWMSITLTGTLAGCGGGQTNNQDETTEATQVDTQPSPEPTVGSPAESPTPSPSQDQSPTPAPTPEPRSTPTPTPAPPDTPDEETSPTPSPTPTPTPTPTATPTPTTTIAQVVEVGPNGRFRFEPDSFEINAGDTVKWVWRAGGHNVKASSTPMGSDWSGTPGSNLYDSGQEYTYTFDVPGEYDYYCAPHRSAGMVASFTVV